MASEQWLLNDTSVASGAYFTAITGGSYKLQNSWATTRNRVTSSPTPYEGAGCYASGTLNEDGMRFRSSANADLTGTSGTYYFDTYAYLPTGFTDFVAPILTGNDATVEYSWVQPNTDTSLSFGAYNPVDGLISTNTTATGKFSTNAWFRIQAKTNQYGMNEFRVFVGSNINGTTPSTTVTPVDFGATYGHSTYQRLYGMVGNGSTYPIYLDSIKFDNAAYPTRGNEQWLLNDTSVANGAYFTPVGLSLDYKLQNDYGYTVSRTTSSPSPYEGAGCYAASGNYGTLPIVNADNSAITDTGAKYADFYLYFNANPATGAHSPLGSGNNAAVEYGSVGVYPNGSVGLISYDAVAGTGSYGTPTAAGFITPGSWMRVQAKVGQKVVEEIKIYKGFNINGTSPDATLTGTKYSGTKDGISFGQSPTGDYHWLDDIKFSNSAYPTRALATQTVSPSGIASTVAFGTAKINRTVPTTGIASTVSFGTAKINRTVPTTGIASTVSFGTASVSVASATQTLSPSGIASTVAFGTAQINRTVPTTGIASSNTFGTAQLNQTLTTTGIASTVAFGTASVLPSQIVTATGIAATTAFGTAQVNLSLSATGITSTTAFGTPQLNLGISLTGISSTTAFGTAQLTVFVPVTGIPSTTTLGVPQVNLGITTVGIGSTGALGNPQLNLTIVGVGAIASTIVFGTAEVGGTVPNLVGRRSSVAGSAGRTSATGATGRTTLV
jgi:hypothetical protein